MRCEWAKNTNKIRIFTAVTFVLPSVFIVNGPVIQRVRGSAAWQADPRDKSLYSSCLVSMRSRVAAVPIASSWLICSFLVTFKMASCSWAENILQLLRKMNNFYLPGMRVAARERMQRMKAVWEVTTSNFVSTGSRRSSCFRFEIEGAQVGWIPPHVASLLARYPDVFSPPHQGAVTLCHSLDSYEKRSEAVSHVVQALRQEPSLTCLKGWRDEVRHASQTSAFTVVSLCGFSL